MVFTTEPLSVYCAGPLWDSQENTQWKEESCKHGKETSQILKTHQKTLLLQYQDSIWRKEARLLQALHLFVNEETIKYTELMGGDRTYLMLINLPVNVV